MQRQRPHTLGCCKPPARHKGTKQMAQRGALEDRLVVLIGGDGFIGGYLAAKLLDRDARLRIAGRRPEKGIPSEAARQSRADAFRAL